MEEKKIIHFYAGVFLMDATLSMIMLTVPLYAIKMGAGPVYLGFLGATYTLFYIIFSLFFGHKSDFGNHRTLVSAASVLLTILYILIAATSSLPMLFIFYSLSGIGVAMFWPVMESWMVRFTPSFTLPSRVGHFNISWSLGSMMGPTLGGFFYEIQYRFPFIVAIFFCIIICFLILHFRPSEFLLASETSTPKPSLTSNSEASEMAIPPLLRVAWVANFSSWFSLGIVRYLFPKLAVELKFRPAFTGFMMFILYASQSLMFLLLSKRVRGESRLGILISFQLLGLLSLFSLSRVQSLFLIPLAFAGMGMMCGITYFFSIYHSLAGGKEAGRKSGIHEGVLGSGGLLGPLLGGLLIWRWGSRSPYTFAAMVITGSIFLESYIFSFRPKSLQKKDLPRQ